MYLVVANMRRLLSVSIANSTSNSSSPSTKHSAIDPRHSDLIGMKSTADEDDDDGDTWTAKIAQITSKP